ncbi:MAG: flagellar hook-basal body protein [Desulfotomaculales bacterium]
MYDLLGIGRAALQAQQTRLAVTADNIANVNTTAFKAARPCFADLLYRDLAPRGIPPGGASVRAQAGTGTAVVAVLRDGAPGALLATGRALDLAIEGEGFFGVTTPAGETLYTRDGTFYLDAEGRLVNAAGYAVEPGITVGEGAVSVQIGPDGTVTAVNADGTTEEAGRLKLYTFANPAGLEARGGNLFAATDAGGAPREAAPGEGAGPVRSGRLEASNTDLAGEMTALLLAQRAYQAAARTVQAADEMWAEANDLGPR